MALVQRLAELRPAARYLNSELAADAEQVAELLRQLAEMERHVRGVVSGDPAYRRRRYQAIATRKIRAGRPARDGDCTIVSPKGPPMATAAS